MSLRASVAYVLVRGVAGAMGMVALALFVRGLGPEQYAHFALGIAAAALASNLVIIPVNSTLARLYGHADGRANLLATLTGLVLLAGAVMIVLSLAVEALGVSWLASWVLPAAAVFAAGQGYLDFSAQIANSRLEPARYARLLLLRALGISAFGALALWLGVGVPGVLLGMALACVVSLAFSAPAFTRPVIDRASLHRVFAFALPLMLTCAFSYLLQWSDRYLLARGVPMAELGRYSALADFTQQALTLFFAGLSSAWYPRVVQAWGKQDRDEAERLMSRLALMGLALMLPAGMGLASELPALAQLLFGPAYAGLPGMLPVCLIAASCVAATKSFYFDVRVLLAERVWLQAVGIGLSAALAILLMYLLVPRFGVLGAASGLLAGQCAGLVYSMFAGRGVLKLRVDIAAILVVVLASLVMFCVLRVLPHGGVLIQMARMLIAILVYGVVLLAFDVDGMRVRLLVALRSRLA